MADERARRGRRRAGGLPLLLALALVAASPPLDTGASTPDDVDENWVGDALAVGGQLLEHVDTDDFLQTWRSFNPAELTQFWSTLTTALSSGSPDDLAALDPYAHQALEWMDTVPDLGPMADWLRQRLDYLDVAATLEEAVTPASAGPPAPSTPSAKPEPKPELKPAPANPPTPTSASLPARTPIARPATSHRSLGVRERKVEFWKQRLEGRKIPASRTEVIPRLKAIFREEGVPEDLVWIAEAESTLNPSARSPSGAVGLFQFMPATAGRFGLQTRPRDERLEPEKSARAAAKYLRVLNGQFRDWPLALAAYNAGEGRVGRALKRSRGRTFDAAAPHLPTETQLYVPKVLATIALREGRAFRDG
ncbi:MAG: lytic transglycosylase domain-containing protein [Lentisphaerae bacterium]|nr:lytic transglycosylase domain-containing protein [Lentisphaerota bacterium]